MKVPIIYSDEFLMVINKPAGIVVNDAQTVDQSTIQTWIQENYPNSLERNGIVHRLDKETSGALIIAKNESVFSKLQAMFKKREVQKQYLALVHGRVKDKDGTIDMPLKRNPYDREKFVVGLGGREARTEYQAIAILRGHQKPKVETPDLASLRIVEILNLELWQLIFNKKINYDLNYNESNKQYEYYTLLLVTPKTGRTHQIRVHLKHLGFPIVGDEKYAGRRRAKRARKWCPRHFLHAYHLEFTHPKTGKSLSLFASLPEDLKTLLN